MAVDFGVREFQFTLLPRMADLAPDRVEQALTDLDATRAEMRAAYRRWLAMAHARRAPRGLTRYKWALGPPATTTRRRFGDLTCGVARWPLPLWPDLLFEVLTGPDGDVWNDWLIRPPSSPPPDLPPPPDLTPWSCVVSDVTERFPDARDQEGSAPTRWTVLIPWHDGTHRADFVHGLLQHVTPP
ncbi:hypothetical protein [Actinomadura rayongensis]|uniref:Uncharacterized protein n=1 Tax=Actinomadura rayongensis TaxID=1429076 RepID=A0A6I4W1S7_9ACTN|nr:hypothetical protein [Actinomadura rayongensis]MXQ63391.1 hypothetical protein [Actinomadura rayongensis]